MDLEIIKRDAQGTAQPTPLLFVHGAWHGAWCWDEYFLSYFAQAGYDSWAFSLRGHGGSPGRITPSWAKHYLADLTTMVASLPKPPVLVGHSMGGYLVQKYLEQNQQIPAGVLLAAVPPQGVLRTTLRIATHYPLDFLKVNLSLNLRPLIARPELAKAHFFSPDYPDHKVKAYWEKMNGESYLTFLDMLLLRLPRPGRVRTPLLVLGGSRDTVFHPYEIEATGRAYHTQAHLIPHTAHDMMLEATWQQTADLILAWLRERRL